MDSTKNSGETREEKTSENSTEKKGKRDIFGLTEESLSEKVLIIEQDKAIRPKDFLEKLHTKNHELSLVETIHEFCREEITEIENDSDLLSDEDEYLFSDIENALTEKDIIDLRANLHSISEAIKGCQFNCEEIEKYLEGDLASKETEMIQFEAAADLNFAEEIDLYRNIDEAIGEKDIMQLRSNLRTIILTESSHARSLEEIEDYLGGEMEDSLKSSLENELLYNTDLASEVKLFNEINEAIAEKDIMNIRTSLTGIGKNAYNREIRGVKSLPIHKIAKRFWYVAAASVVLLAGINILFFSFSGTNAELYGQFYSPTHCNPGTTRSAFNSEEISMSQALTLLSLKEYDQALKLFSMILDRDGKNPAANYYCGTIYQIKKQFTAAVESYKKVAEEGDNLFVEQANWYLGLCYLILDQRSNAINQFRIIASENGYFKQESLSILKKIRQD